MKKNYTNSLHILLIFLTVISLSFSAGCKKNLESEKTTIETNSSTLITETETPKNTENTTEKNTEEIQTSKNDSETEKDVSGTEVNTDDTTAETTTSDITTDENTSNSESDSSIDNKTEKTSDETSTDKPTGDDGSIGKEYGPFPKPTVNVGIIATDSVESAIEKIVNGNVTGNMSIEEKIKILHDYLIYTVDYDVEGFMKYAATGNMEESFNPDVFTAKGALINKISVCQGYAEAFKLMMDRIGVNNIIVYGTGNGNSHAWNMVEINGFWYHVDVTFDDPCSEGYDKDGNYVMTNRPGGENISYTYFLTTDDIIKNNHTIDISETEKMNSNISKYPSAKANDKTFLNMVYPWFEIVSAEELSKLKNYFDKGIYEIRIMTDLEVYKGDAFWSNIGNYGYSYEAYVGALGKKVVVHLKMKP